MSTAYFICGGIGYYQVGQEAERLHPGFEGLLECPQKMLPELAGRRLFLLQFDDVESADVEVIRQGLIQKLHTRAWSMTADAEGNTTLYPTRTASDGLPRGVRLRYEEDHPPWHHEGYDDDDDDDDGDEAWDYPGPRTQSHGRRHSVGPDYGHGDDYDQLFGPHSHRGPRRSSFAINYDHDDGDDEDDGDEAWDYPRRRFQSHRRRHSFGHDYGHGDEYDQPYGSHSHRGPRRSSFAMDYDHDHDFLYPSAPPPSHTRRSRTSRHPATYDRYGSYPRDFSPPRHHARRSHTFASFPTANDRRDSYVPPPRDPPDPWDRPTYRSRGTHPPQHARSSTYRHNRRERDFASPFTGYHSTRDALQPTRRAARPSTSTQLPYRRRGRGRWRRVWGMIRSFLAV